MSSLSSIINVQISRQTSVPTRAGFGTGAFISAQASFTNPSKEYSDLSDLLESGDAGADSEAAAARYFGQQVSPTKLTVIKEISSVAQISTLTFSEELVTLNSTLVTLDGVAGTPVVYGASHADTMDAIAAQILTDFTQITTAVAAGNVITITADVVDVSFTVSALVTAGATQPTVASVVTTLAGGLSATLTAAIAYKNDWYALTMHSRLSADIEEVSDYIQGLGTSNPKLFFAQSSEAGILNPGSTADIASLLTAKANFRTSIWYHATDADYLEVGVVGGQLPSDAGSITWAYKAVSGIAADVLSTGEKNAAHAKNCNTYTNVASVNITEEGKTSDTGAGEWIDTIRGVDWIQVNMQADLFTILINSPKIPYDDSGIALFKAEVIKRLGFAQGQGILRADISPQVIAPKRSDVSAADVAARVLNGLKFAAVLAGAIQKVNVVGVVTL